MKIRFAKVRTTDHRPAGAAASPAGMTGLDHLAARQRREAEQHDRNVRDYTPPMAQAAYADLHDRSLAGLDYMEKAWIQGRRAALLRLGTRMKREGLA